ncbi:MAG TPA: NAD(P)-binding domain-containing protein [Vicinamibacterales bacterium]|jgi:cation diffusion facilitator CzcD-associated flavoprotein CzcO|nr:NAD(P)-binding domain-containing protein [Vicinamibacterales bacterium]
MTTPTTTDLLIIGAGPYGLTMAAHARHLGIDHIIVGEPMRFWRAHMPNGMYLRSACDWHLDTLDEETIGAFLRTQDLAPADVEPLSRDRYLDYARWFQARKQIDPWPVVVEQLDGGERRDERFVARLAGGGAIAAKNVLLAIGLAPFKHVPEDLARLLPPGCVEHTCDLVDFTGLRDQRCLIVGGRQSAFEWAALLCEAGAAAVHVAHRHDSPAFAASDWSWVSPLVDGMVENPGWYRQLIPAEKEELNQRFWAEGRLKLEPWLAPRVRRPQITLWPNTRVGGGRQLPDGRFAMTIEGPGGSRVLDIDRIVLATGYKVLISRVPLLAHGNLLPRLQMDNGVPVLDQHLQTSVAGLFMTSMVATRDFGPFFAFTVAVRTSAKLIGQALRPV